MTERPKRHHARQGIAALGLLVLALAGCSSMTDDASAECLREAGAIGSYEKAHASSGAVDEVAGESVTDVKQRTRGSDVALDVTGTSQVRIGGAWHEATWQCFSQVVDGTRYTSLIAWR